MSRLARLTFGRPLLIAGFLAAALLAASATAYSAVRSPIEGGDIVYYHFEAHHQDGRLAAASDVVVARKAIEDGTAGPAVESNLTADWYGARSGTVRLTSQGKAFVPSVYFVGHRVGDTIETPFVVAPYGYATEFRIPKALGPVRTNTTLDLARLYSSTNASKVEPILGPREGFATGTEFNYGDQLIGLVDGVSGDSAAVSFRVASGTRVYSKVFGWNFTLEEAGPGLVFLHPALAVGDVFTTRGCELPLESLPAGRYVVFAEDADSYSVRTAPHVLEHLYGETLSFRFTILSVEKWGAALGELQRRAADLAGRWF